MKAVYYVGACRAELRDIPIPVPAPDEYLIHIDACGVCGSDVEGFLGKTGRRVPPMIMGHECSGTVAQTPVGGNLAVGTKVVIYPKFFCGECADCRSGRPNVCANAKFLGVMDYDGAMTEYVCVRERYLIPYAGISAEIASLVEPAAVAYAGVSKITDEELLQAEHILVIGAGTIGLMAMLWLKYRGAKHVIVSDAVDSRCELARRMGADDTVNPAKCGDFQAEIARLTDGKMCDFSVEAVGISPTAQSSITALRSAGTAVWIGNAAKMVSVDMQRIVTGQLTIRGTYIYTYEDFVRVAELLSAGVVDATAMISLEMDMSKGVEAFDMLTHNADGKLIKVVLTNKGELQ